MVLILFAGMGTVACEGFSDNQVMNAVDGRLFSDPENEYLFGGTCFFSQDYNPVMIPYYEDMAELSCLAESNGRKWSYCIYIGIPKEAIKINDGQVTLPSHCKVRVKFVRFSGDLFNLESEYSATARFSGDSFPYNKTTGGNTNPCNLKIRLSMNRGGGVVSLKFNSVHIGTIFSRL